MRVVIARLLFRGIRLLVFRLFSSSNTCRPLTATYLANVCCPSYLNRFANFFGRSELTFFISVSQPSVYWGTHTRIFRILRNPYLWKQKERGGWHRTQIVPVLPIAGQNFPPRYFEGYLAVIYYKRIVHEVVLVHVYHYIVQSRTCFDCPEPSSERVFIYKK